MDFSNNTTPIRLSLSFPMHNHNCTNYYWEHIYLIKHQPGAQTFRVGGGSYGPRVTLRIQISYELSPWMIITCTHLFTYASQYPCQKIILPVDKAYILHSTLLYWSPQTIFPILLLADVILGMVTYSLLQVNVVPVVFVFLPKKLCPTSLPEFIQFFLLDLYSFFT